MIMVSTRSGDDSKGISIRQLATRYGNVLKQNLLTINEYLLVYCLATSKLYVKTTDNCSSVGPCKCIRAPRVPGRHHEFNSFDGPPLLYSHLHDRKTVFFSLSVYFVGRFENPICRHGFKSLALMHLVCI